MCHRLIATALAVSVVSLNDVSGSPVSAFSGDPAPNARAVVSVPASGGWPEVRFTLLTAGFVRIQAGPAFDDRASAVIVNRALPVPPFSVARPAARAVTITTPLLTLTFDGSAPPPPPADAAVCGFPAADVAVAGGVRTRGAPFGLNASSAGACCAACTADVTCVGWTFIGANATCGLYVQAWQRFAANVALGAVSGVPHAPFSAANLRVDFRVARGERGAWAPGAADASLPGTYEKLECYESATACADYFATSRGSSLLSRAGWALVDDSRTVRLVPTALPSYAGATVPWAAPTAPAATIDWYLLARGRDYRAALADWVSCSGAASLPPSAAFGVAWSRWFKYSQTSFTEEVLAGYADHGLPLTTAILDMDWHNVNFDPSLACNGWGSFDFNTTLWPDALGFVTALRNGANPLLHRIELGLNMHDSVGVDRCESRYAEFAALMGVDASARAPIACDFANVSYVDAVYRVFIDAPPLALMSTQWADWGGCDPPNTAPYNPPGGGGSILMAPFTNLFWANHAMAVMPEATRGARAWTFSRYAGYGSQRAPVGFSGDAFQSWKTLAWQAQSVASAANVVFPYWSFDIGGYMCDASDAGPGCDANTTSAAGAELLLRWYQFGAVSPVFRSHCEQCERRIWLFDFFTELRDALVFRNALAPYLYSEARATYESGVAAVHPLYYDWPEEAPAYDEGQYMLGGVLLVAPIVAPAPGGVAGGAAPRTVWLPPGAAWSDLRGSTPAPGPASASRNYSRQELPAFARAGALLPLATPRDTVGSPLSPPDPLVWAAWPPPGGWAAPTAPAAGAYELYEDDGASLDYRAPGAGARTAAAMTVVVDGGATLVHGPRAGGEELSRAVWWQLRGWPAGVAPRAVTVGGLAAPRVDEPTEGSAGPQTPGWWIVTNYSLAAPAGSLVVCAGRVSGGARVELTVTPVVTVADDGSDAGHSNGTSDASLADGGHVLNVSYAGDGTYAIVYDGFPLVSTGWPALAIGWTWSNGTSADYNYVTVVESRAFDAPSTTFSLRYKWGNVTVAHAPSVPPSPLSFDVIVGVDVSASLPGPGLSGLGVGINGLLGYYAANSSDFMFPAAITGAGNPCGVCWPPLCGDTVQCSPAYPQALPIDFSVGALAWLRVGAPPPPPPGPLADAWWAPMVHSRDPLAAGSRYTLIAQQLGAVSAGASSSARYSLRFGDGSGATPLSNVSQPLALIADVLHDFAERRPFVAPVLSGRGPIGALFGSNCGSSCTCKSVAPADCPCPRGWDNDILDGAVCNTTTAAGVAVFQNAARAFVSRSVAYCRDYLGCQAILFWSIEGSEFNGITYAGSPDLLPLLAPEMDSVADELFAMVVAAGMRVGCTLRPQVVTQTPSWNASVAPNARPERYFQRELFLPDNATDVAGIAANLIRKASYAIRRWNASIFYVDSTADSRHGTLPSSVWDIVRAALPDVAFIPEETDYAVDFSAVTPLQDNWGGAAYGVAPAAKTTWPRAFNFQLMQVDVNETAAPFDRWVALAAEGDVFRVDAWYNSTRNVFVKSVLDAAKGAKGPPAPPP